MNFSGKSVVALCKRQFERSLLQLSVILVPDIGRRGNPLDNATDDFGAAELLFAAAAAARTGSGGHGGDPAPAAAASALRRRPTYVLE